MIKNHKDYWQEIKDCTMTTISKTTGKYPTPDWKLKLLICEHSPIRKLKLNWKWDKLKSWVSVHMVRHKHGIEHWVSSRRTDRTGVDRNALRQDELVSHEIEFNAQSAINVSRKRLCSQASPETRLAWSECIKGFEYIEPELYFVCVPECVYRGGCSEFTNCGFYDNLKEKSKGIDLSNIKDRYNAYHSLKNK